METEKNALFIKQIYHVWEGYLQKYLSWN